MLPPRDSEVIMGAIRPLDEALSIIADGCMLAVPRDA
jgi:hypothetical protein